MSRHLDALPLRLVTATLLAGGGLLLAAGAAAAQSNGASAGHDRGSASTPATTQRGSGSATTSGHGDSNAGDVWTDTVGQPSGPGHEQDPHLPCADINLWGAGLADPSGTYTIAGWPPSGAKAVDYSSTWIYDRSTAGTQVVSVISIQQLIAAAVARGEAPVNRNGFHFKLDLSQDPHKHKTFWVACPSAAAESTAPTGSGTAAAATTATAAPGTTGQAAATPAGASGSEAASGSAAASGPATAASGAGGVEGLSAGATPAAAAAPAGGVLGIATPATGAAFGLGLALLLIGGGAALVVATRRARRSA